MNYEKYIIDTAPFCKPDYEDTDGKIGYSLGFGSEELCNLGERFTRAKRSDVSMIEGKETPFFSAHASVGNLWVACGVSGSHRDVRYNIDEKDVRDWNDFIRGEINTSKVEKITPEAMNYKKYIIDVCHFGRPEYKDVDGRIGYKLGFGSEILFDLGKKFTSFKRSKFPAVKGEDIPFFSTRGNLWVDCGVSGLNEDHVHFIDRENVYDWNDFIHSEINKRAESLTPEGVTFLGRGGKLALDTSGDVEFSLLSVCEIGQAEVNLQWNNRGIDESYEEFFYYSRPIQKNTINEPQQHFVNWIHSLTGVKLDLSDESMCVLHKILCNLARALFGTKN